jgi:hypothetical protein
MTESENDREEHEAMHRTIICGGMPLEVREFLKGFGWAVAHSDKNFHLQREKWAPEIGKRAVVFAWWTRALANGVPENDCDAFMEAHFAFVDARVDGNETALAKATEGIKRWKNTQVEKFSQTNRNELRVKPCSSIARVEKVSASSGFGEIKQ